MKHNSTCGVRVPVAVPEGWKLVPIEPTTEMCLADWNVSMSDAHSTTGVSRCAWEAMLAAAPEYEPDTDGVKGLDGETFSRKDADGE